MEAPVPPTEGLCAPGAAHFHSQHFCTRQKGLRPRFLCRLHNRLTIQADTAARFLPSFPSILFQCRSGSIHEPISWWRKGVPFQPTAGGQTHRCAVRKANCTSLARATTSALLPRSVQFTTSLRKGRKQPLPPGAKWTFSAPHCSVTPPHSSLTSWGWIVSRESYKQTTNRPIVGDDLFKSTTVWMELQYTHLFPHTHQNRQNQRPRQRTAWWQFCTVSLGIDYKRGLC